MNKKQEKQQMLIDLSKRLIAGLTTELNSEVEKLNIDLTKESENDIITNCDGTIAKLNSRISQLKSILISFKQE